MSYKYCPHCGGTLPPPIEIPDHESPSYATKSPPPDEPQRIKAPAGPEKYNQDAVWKSLIQSAQSSAGDKPYLMIRSPQHGASPPHSSVVHLLFKGPVTPRGGLLWSQVGRASPTQEAYTPPMDRETLEAMNYVVGPNGKIVTNMGVPISPVALALEYWGGNKQYKRWHLAYPIKINPSRSGPVEFMDNELVAFSASWTDLVRVEESIHMLIKLLSTGVRDSFRKASSEVHGVDVFFH